MKIRNGYVSNSSSSSFIITDKNNFNKVIDILNKIDKDYYILKETMYTSLISDGHSPEYSQLYDLAIDTIEGNNIPYSEDQFIEIEGTKGVDSIWLPKECLETQDYINLNLIPPIIKDKLCEYISNIVKYNKHREANKEQLFEVLENCKQIIEGNINDYQD